MPQHQEYRRRMTLQEIAQARAVWAAKVVALFVVAGGAAGGAAVGVALAVTSIASSPDYYFGVGLTSLLQLPISLLVMSCFGILFGFPPAVVSAAAYIIGVKTMRSRWRLVALGMAVSLLWCALFSALISSGLQPLQTYLGVAALFVLAGAVAALVCFRLLQRWRLQAPVA